MSENQTFVELARRIMALESEIRTLQNNLRKVPVGSGAAVSTGGVGSHPHSSHTGIEENDHHSKLHAAVHAVGEADELSHDALKDFLATEHRAWESSIAQDIHIDNYIEGGAGKDTTAIHDNGAQEIKDIAAEVTPTVSDWILIEDASDSYNKKSLQLTNLYKALTHIINDNVVGQIHAVTNKVTPVAADEVLIEDSAASWAKKRIALSTIAKALGTFPNLVNFLSGQKTNTISEYTADVGVTVDSVLLKDGLVAGVNVNAGLQTYGISSYVHHASILSHALINSTTDLVSSAGFYSSATGNVWLWAEIRPPDWLIRYCEINSKTLTVTTINLLWDNVAINSYIDRAIIYHMDMSQGVGAKAVSKYDDPTNLGLASTGSRTDTFNVTDYVLNLADGDTTLMRIYIYNNAATDCRLFQVDITYTIT